MDLNLFIFFFLRKPSLTPFCITNIAENTAYKNNSDGFSTMIFDDLCNLLPSLRV